MEISQRRTVLFAVVDQAQEARREWSESDVEHFTQALGQAFDELIETFSAGDLPADCRAMADAVGQFEREWGKWKELAETRGDPNLLPDGSVWKTLDVVAEMRRRAVPKHVGKLETIAELTEQKVGDRQIALIYGFECDDGSPNLSMVREERAAPGKHTGPGTGWVPPLERVLLEEAERQLETARRIQAREEAKMERLERSAPESLGELVETGVAAPQIAKMLNLSVEEVLSRCEMEGLGAPASSYPTANAMQGVHDKDPSAAQARVFDAMAGNPVHGQGDATELEEGAPERTGSEPSGPMSLDQEIVHYAETTEWSHTEIAEAVTSEAVPVSRQKVSGVLKRHAERAEAFESVPGENG